MRRRPDAPAPDAGGDPRRAPLRELLACVAAFAALNALLSFEVVGQGSALQLQLAPRLSFDWCVSVAVLAAWQALRGPLSPRAVAWLGAGFVGLMGLRALDVGVPAVFGRPLNLYWDAPHAFEVSRLLLQAVPAWQTLLGAGLGAIGLLALHRGVAGLLGVLLRARSRHRPVPALWVATALLGASFAAHPQSGRDTRGFFAQPLAPSVLRQAVLLPSQLWPAAWGAVLPASPSFERGLGALRGADVLIVFAESYGAVALDDPGLALALAADRERLQQALGGSGRGVVSARVQSPTFGGGSWLAHAALLSGLDTADPLRHERLLASTRPTLVGLFQRHGYRTVGWMPGLQRPWPEGRFFGFDRLADVDGIGYQGPAFGYWRVPDQAALALLQAQELPPRDGARAPRFVVFPTLSTHAPFQPLPPYRADWASVTGAGAWSAADVAASQAAREGLREAYRASLHRQFDWLSGWFGGPAPRRLLTVLIGDHQPPAGLAGPHASRDVPVHLISDDRALLQAFERRGFVPGLGPTLPALGAMHELTLLLMEVFEGGEPVPQPATATATAALR